ncbi:MAG: pilus (MSHA type) biogenesis protein MshL [Magnetococcales bacterium]|nr:pilus (MSHA type) biogenesis protein MshL [Magnetococcales bacterium]
MGRLGAGVVWVTTLLLLVSCAGSGREVGKRPDAPHEFQDVLESMGASDGKKPAGQVAEADRDRLPDDVADALLPPLRSTTPETTDTRKPASRRSEDHRIDLIMSEGGSTPARDLFLSLVEGTRYTMIVHPDLNVDISLPLTLVDVTVKEAVDTVCEIYGFDCSFREATREQSWGSFRIFPRRLSTRTFKVDVLAVERKGKSDTTISSGSVSSTTTNTTSAGSATTSSISGSNITTTNDSDFWNELEKTLRTFLGLAAADAATGTTAPAAAPAAGVSPAPATTGATADASAITKNYMINRQAGLVVVRAYPEELREIESFLTKMTRRSRRQVVLEAKIMEVQLNDGFEFGVDWLAISRGIGKSTPLASEPKVGITNSSGGTASAFQGFMTQPTIVTTTATSGTTTTTSQTTEDLYSVVSEPTGLLSRASSDLPFTLALRAHDFSAFIDMLQSQGKVSVLSNPRVSTVNNQKAVIKVGEDEFFLTNLESNVDAETGITLTPTFRNFFSGVALDVVPQIGEDGVITLHIHPLITTVTEKSRTVEFSGTRNTYPLAYSTSRELDTMIRVRNGEMVVLGGLMKKNETETVGKVPLLGDLPWLGQFFSHTEKAITRSELVILLRPLVVETPDDWSKELDRTAQRIRKMEPSPKLWWTDNFGGGKSPSTLHR